MIARAHSHGTWAVIPAKRFDRAKQRLVGSIAHAGCAALAAAMLGDVLEQLSRTEGLAGILVVTRDAEAAAIARSFAAAVLVDPVESGTNDAVAYGIREVSSMGASAAIVVPGDIPFVTSAELGIVLAGLAQAPVVLVPAARDGGTNILGLSPPDAMAPAFGPDSFARHCAAARDLRPAIIPLYGAGHDIDVAADLAFEAVVAKSGSGIRTVACLHRLRGASSSPLERFFKEAPSC